MNSIFSKPGKKMWLAAAGCAVILTGSIFLSGCFNLTNQNPCECALNNIVANTPTYNPATADKCDKYEASLNEKERAEWMKELQACTVGR